MELQLTRKGYRMFGGNVDTMPIHWFCLSDTQKVMLEDLYHKRDISSRIQDEAELQLLLDIGLVKYN